MKNYGYSLCVLFLFKINFVIAQNIVPNGSFESYSVCPSSTSQIYRADSWFQPHKYPNSNSVNQSSSSDYFNSCSLIATNASVPNNFIGYQIPNTGIAYIGLAYYSTFGGGNAGREYAEVKLSAELIGNKKYKLKYYISMANTSKFSITKFDAYLSNDSLLYSSSNLSNIPVIPQFGFSSRISDTLNWVEISGSYIANGGERFLTLGNFHDEINCDTLGTHMNSIQNCCSAYYYIDDVSLELDTLTNIEESSIANFQLYPNPAKGIITISSPQLIQEIIVLDFSSKILFQRKSESTSTTLDLSALDDGIYIVKCKFKNGAIIHKKIVLQKD